MGPEQKDPAMEGDASQVLRVLTLFSAGPAFTPLLTPGYLI